MAAALRIKYFREFFDGAFYLLDEILLSTRVVCANGRPET